MFGSYKFHQVQFFWINFLALTRSSLKFVLLGKLLKYSLFATLSFSFQGLFARAINAPAQQRYC